MYIINYWFEQKSKKLLGNRREKRENNFEKQFRMTSIDWFFALIFRILDGLALLSTMHKKLSRHNFLFVKRFKPRSDHHLFWYLDNFRSNATFLTENLTLMILKSFLKRLQCLKKQYKYTKIDTKWSKEFKKINFITKKSL